MRVCDNLMLTTRGSLKGVKTSLPFVSSDFVTLNLQENEEWFELDIERLGGNWGKLKNWRN